VHKSFTLFFLFAFTETIYVEVIDPATAEKLKEVEEELAIAKVINLKNKLGGGVTVFIACLFDLFLDFYNILIYEMYK